MNTMEWPPKTRGGRLRYVNGIDAASVLILQVVSDLRQQPFNPDAISLGDITFRVQTVNRPLIESALKRVSAVISVESISEELAEDGSARYTILFTDRESRTPGKVSVG